jgi:acetyl esterase/lipase
VRRVADPFPLAVVIHGGFWRARYDLSSTTPLCTALTENGVATWNIEYRRIGTPGGGWPGTFLDVGHAVDNVATLSRDHPLDLGRVITLGHSAGGHLALWAAGRSRLHPGSVLLDESPLPLRGAVSLAGVADLFACWNLHLSGDAVAELLGGAPSEMPERYEQASPSTLLPPSVPQVLIHGTDDENVPYSIAEKYVRAAHASGGDVRLITLPGAGHFEVIDPRSDEWQVVLQVVHSLLAS